MTGCTRRFEICIEIRKESECFAEFCFCFGAPLLSCRAACISVFRCFHPITMHKTGYSLSLNWSEADHTAAKPRHQKRGNPVRILSFLIQRTNLNPNRYPNRSPAKRVRFGKGRRTLRMCSFRGSFANRGNGTEQSSSDVVPVVGLEPTRHRWQRILSPPRLPFQHTGMRVVLYNSFPRISSTKYRENHIRRIFSPQFKLPQTFPRPAPQHSASERNPGFSSSTGRFYTAGSSAAYPVRNSSAAKQTPSSPG